ncbi:MAG: hypothetical protein APR54_01745 [Candidatus Cloacimonas sp. SDB]|nr:MAG: hypothetical protein APR54_01745 [Candidatus Cloacimonas sp. SDB]
MVLETKRLFIKKATWADVDHYLQLWNNPDVMKMVGFPDGLKISGAEIRKQIENHSDHELDQTLVVVEKARRLRIGECKLGKPDADKTSFPDLKLLPEYWGKGYGKEIFNALCQYLFSKTATKIVQTSPNVKNIASEKLAKASGGKKTGTGVYHFPVNKQSFTKDVQFNIYQIRKKDWLRKNLQIKELKDSETKQKICSDVILNLPQWFGIAAANKNYINGVANTLFLTAYMYGEPVGFYSVISHFPETSEIYVCGILEEFQRLGIGKTMQFQLEKILRKTKVKYLTVKTLSSKHPDKNYAGTRKFYQAQDFLPLEEFSDLWGVNNPCLFLVKSLEKFNN